eukprot:1409156-Rhodomonas_salina.1
MESAWKLTGSATWYTLLRNSPPAQPDSNVSRSWLDPVELDATTSTTVVAEPGAGPWRKSMKPMLPSVFRTHVPDALIEKIPGPSLSSIEIAACVEASRISRTGRYGILNCCPSAMLASCPAVT